MNSHPHMQRCQRCPKPALVNITDILGQNADGTYKFKEYRFCDDCAQKFLMETPTGKEVSATDESEDELSELNDKECPTCGITFKDFRLTGRLGCPQDYQVFRAELLPLLENIHSEKQHIGKSPRRHANSSSLRAALSVLRKRLQQAVSREAYEEAARLRDQIRTIERQEA